jgi:hypothetical protein
MPTFIVGAGMAFLDKDQPIRSKKINHLFLWQEIHQQTSC